MPLYTLTTQTGVLDDEAKARLAGELATFHANYAGVPKEWVQVVFHEYARGSGFSAGKPSALASLILLIRTGRSEEYKREMVQRLWDMMQAATGAPDDQLVIGIHEVPPSQAMEMGRTMPDVEGA
ncbi:tautomerase family protein [Paraburkholderia oxyphila]|uniref:tautomerase family protein n=1 Tax=Paraburkholderia oxyphila TaxID=614212 RepID=UPI000489CE63|nr:tautomerase family protein [Paraburkholderia oxyphila]